MEKSLWRRNSGSDFDYVARDAAGYRNGDIIAPLKNTSGKISRVEDKDIIRLLRSVWKSYGKRSANDLIGLCHVPGSPWDQAKKEVVKKLGFLPRSHEIDDGIIKDYYQKIFTFPKPKN